MMKQTSSLNVEKIIAHYAGYIKHARPVAIEVVIQTGSTNSDLMARLPFLSEPTLLVAETQTAGRGRAGRSWLSEPGSSLTFSLAWPFTKSPQALLGLPLAVGVALAQALSSMDVSVQLKWPNDVLKGGKKLAGVLIETANHISSLNNQQNLTWSVIGVGLNLLMPDELEHEIGRPVACATWLAQMDKNQLLATLLNYLVTCLQQFSNTGFSPFVPKWNALHAYAGQQVCLLNQGQITQQGTALGVDNSGRLLLQDQYDVIWPIVAGDVSLRPI